MTDRQDTTMGSFVMKTEMPYKGIFCALTIHNPLMAADIETESQTCWHLAGQALCIQGQWNCQILDMLLNTIYTHSPHCKVNNIKRSPLI